MTTHRAPMPKEAVVETTHGNLVGFALGATPLSFGAADSRAHESAIQWLNDLVQAGTHYVGRRSEITMEDVLAWRKK